MSSQDKPKKNIAIMFGGCSSEYGVSLESSSAVIRNLNREKYNPVLIGITREGEWFHFTGEVGKIAADTWCNEKDCLPAVLSPNPKKKALLVFDENGVKEIGLDAAFPVMHGKNGEDGTLQGLLELAQIPLVGCSTLASALCMDKDRAHKLVQMAGIRVPQATVLERRNMGSGQEDKEVREASAAQAGKGSCKARVEMDSCKARVEMDSCEARAARDFAKLIGFPIFVKPVKAGSSYGVTKVMDEGELLPALELAFQYDNQVILEENIDGFEVGCAVLGTEELLVGEVDEIELSGGFFDFTEKYTLKTSAIHVPARISKEKAKEVKEAARKIYRALGCNGFARVDMFLMPCGEIVFNEVNTIPGFTEHSRYPGMMKAAGIPFAEIVERVVGAVFDGGGR